MSGGTCELSRSRCGLAMLASAARIEQPEGGFLGSHRSRFGSGLGGPCTPACLRLLMVRTAGNGTTVPGAAFLASRVRIWASAARSLNAESKLLSCRARSSRPSVFSARLLYRRPKMLIRLPRRAAKAQAIPDAREGACWRVMHSRRAHRPRVRWADSAGGLRWAASAWLEFDRAIAIS